jgi:hypothetical protein
MKSYQHHSTKSRFKDCSAGFLPIEQTFIPIGFFFYHHTRILISDWFCAAVSSGKY